MDKYEYKVRLEEINSLIIDKDFAEAAIIADSIDWRRVKSLKTLCMISDVYKYVGRLEDAEDLLLLAYEKRPSSKSVVFALCELCIKLDQYVQAVEYYKEYVLLAPEDYGRYVLQYKLYVAQDVSLDERIEVLLELKKAAQIPKWQYELAYLYHRTGNSTRCIEECDELILWYGEGKYVTKAMELKMQHSPLTPTQQAKYDTKDITASLYPVDEETYQEVVTEPEETPQVKTDVGEYNTINLQKELADSMKDMWEVTSDNLIRPVSTSLDPTEAKTVEDAGTSAYTTVPEATTVFSKQEVSEELEEITRKPADAAEDEGQLEFVIEDDPMATKVLQEIRAENKSDAIISESTEEVGFNGTIEKFIGMEYDGQMSMIVPEESEQIEKQITGQLRIEDILAEWEEKKKENEKRREEEVRQLVLEHTGNILIDFDVAVRDGLLEKLEKEPVDLSAEYNLDEEAETEEGEVEETEAEEDQVAQEVFFEDNAPLDEDFEEEEAVPEEMTFEEEFSEEEVTEEEPIEEELPLEEVVEEEEPEEETAKEEVVAEEEPQEVKEEDKEEVEEKAEKEVKEEKEEKKENADVIAAEAAAEAEDDSEKPRELTKEEKELYASYIQNKKIQAQLANAIDSVSLAPYVGNIVITGDEGMDPVTLAKNIMKEIQTIDSNFSGKIAKISGNVLNTREPAEIVGKISNGALIIENAGKMNPEIVDKLYKALQNEDAGIIVVLSGGKKSIGRLLEANPKLKECFASQIDLEALDNDTLVKFGKEYAHTQEYAIDEMGLLALHTKISDHQTSDHAVTIIEVKEMISEAIRNANRKNAGHFFDVLFGKRFDDEDMIILKEKDFA